VFAKASLALPRRLILVSGSVTAGVRVITATPTRFVGVRDYRRSTICPPGGGDADMGRFKRVIDILDEAIGGPDTSFAAHGPFWRGVTRDDFVKLDVMHRDLLVVGDGAASNVIKALRGQARYGARLHGARGGP
jgi:hypothetical protein